MNDKTSSLIVFLKEDKGPVGVYLSSWEAEHHHFYPVNGLYTGTTEYPSLVYNDDSTKVSFDQNTPSPDAIRFTLYQHRDFKGDWITLPGGHKFLEDDLGLSVQEQGIFNEDNDDKNCPYKTSTRTIAN
jgi:hypothetical protein